MIRSGRKPAREAAVLDPEVEDQLRQLGYLGAEEEAPGLWGALDARDLERILRSLKAGADPSQREKDTGITPLTLAALNGDVELAKVLLEAGAPVDGRNQDGSTPLSAASLLGKAGMVEFLLKKGADPAAKSAQGASILDATKAPWEITEFVARLFGIRPDRAEGVGNHANKELRGHEV